MPGDIHCRYVVGIEQLGSITDHSRPADVCRWLVEVASADSSSVESSMNKLLDRTPQRRQRRRSGRVSVIGYRHQEFTNNGCKAHASTIVATILRVVIRDARCAIQSNCSSCQPRPVGRWVDRSVGARRRLVVLRRA